MSERLTEEEKVAMRQRASARHAWPGLGDIERCLDALDVSEAENAALRARAEQAEARLANTQPYIKRAQEMQAERDALRTDLREARELLEEATGYTDSTGLPMTESLLGRIVIFLQRTEGRAG